MRILSINYFFFLLISNGLYVNGNLKAEKVYLTFAKYLKRSCEQTYMFYDF